MRRNFQKGLKEKISSMQGNSENFQQAENLERFSSMQKTLGNGISGVQGNSKNFQQAENLERFSGVPEISGFLSICRRIF